MYDKANYDVVSFIILTYDILYLFITGSIINLRPNTQQNLHLVPIKQENS